MDHAEPTSTAARSSRDGGVRIILRSLRRNRGRLVGSAALLCVHQTAEALVPVFIGAIVDRAVTTGDTAALLRWLVALAALFGILTLGFRFGDRMNERAATTEAHTLRMAAAAKILHPLGIRTELRTGELLTVASADVNDTAALLGFIPRVAGAVAALVVCAVGLLVVDLRIGAAVLIGTPLVLGLVQALAPRITRRVIEQQRSVGKVAALATDLVAGLRPLHGIGAEEAAVARYQTASRKALTSMIDVARAQGVFIGVGLAVSTLLAASVAIAAGWLALSGSITVGELITVLGLSQFLLGPLGLLAALPGRLARTLGSARRLALIEDAPFVRADGVARLGAGPHRLSLRGVGFGSLTDLDLEVEPGEFLGVVADQPSDGSALTKVLAGDLPGEAGTILLGGERLDRLAHDDRRRELLVEPHNTDLFTGTLIGNLNAGNDSATPAEIDAALRAAAAMDVVSEDLGGLDNHVAERGSTLSGGQRQRVALARALLAQPAVLVLHDPTTAVDAVTEHAIAEGLVTLRHTDSEQFTTIVVTSSPTLLAKAHRVVLISAGSVVAEGSHAELAASDEFYRQAVLR